MVIGVFPYLVPLMFQVGFGLSPFEAGLLFLSTMVGNLSMKSATVWVIRSFRFRSVLIVNGCLVALFTFLTALLLPTTPVWIIVLTLFLSGLVRSMQFSSLTTLAFADIPEHDMTSANTLYSTIQQMSIGMGIAIGAVALRFFERTERRRAGTIRSRISGWRSFSSRRSGSCICSVTSGLARRRQRGADQKRPFGGRCASGAAGRGTAPGR